MGIHLGLERVKLSLHVEHAHLFFLAACGIQPL
jgi:hypothetical protein